MNIAFFIRYPIMFRYGSSIENDKLTDLYQGFSMTDVTFDLCYRQRPDEIFVFVPGDKDKSCGRETGRRSSTLNDC